MQVLQPVLDDARDGKITREEFITAFACPEEDEELDHATAEQEHNERLAQQKAEQAKKAEEVKQNTKQESAKKESKGFDAPPATFSNKNQTQKK